VPAEILTLRPSPHPSERVSELIEKSRTSQMTSAEEDEWQKYEYLEHLVRMAKASVKRKLAPPGPNA